MFTTYLRYLTIFACIVAGSAIATHAQSSADPDAGYSDSTPRRTSSARNRTETNPATLLRAARTIYVETNDYIDAAYLEYKLGKYPDFQQWKLVMVHDKDRADLVLNVVQKDLNYIFSIEDRASSVVITNGKTVAINDPVATEEIAKEIIKKMKAIRALPTDAP